MRIKDVPIPLPRGRSSGLLVQGKRAAVLAHLNKRNDEVFETRSVEIARAIGAKESTVSHALWSLWRDGLISKARLPRATWYGSHNAIEKLISLSSDGVLEAPPSRR